MNFFPVILFSYSASVCDTEEEIQKRKLQGVTKNARL